MLEVDLCHTLLEQEGIPTQQAEQLFPTLPLAIAENYHPWYDDHLEDVRDLIREYIRALEFGVTPGYLLTALKQGIWPGVATRFWNLNRSMDDCRIVEAHAVAADLTHPKLGRDSADPEKVWEERWQQMWVWLATPIPADRIALYIAAGVDSVEAEAEHEPMVARGGALEGVELLAKFRRTTEYERELTLALD